MSGVQPLAASDRRLRSGRYEVSAFAAREPETAKTPSRRKRLSGPHRFATEAAARAFAATLTGDTIYIDRVAPISSRYPDGPWSTRSVDRLPGAAS